MFNGKNLPKYWISIIMNKLYKRIMESFSSRFPKAFSDLAYIKLKYKLRFNRDINLSEPTGFNEKLSTWQNFKNIEWLGPKRVQKHAGYVLKPVLHHADGSIPGL